MLFKLSDTSQQANICADALTTILHDTREDYEHKEDNYEVTINLYKSRNT